MSGPYDTERQALVDAPGAGPGGQHNQLVGHLAEVLAMADVDLGVFDRRIVDWLAGWEPATVQAVCGWIIRAYQAGHTDGINAGRAPSPDTG